MKIKIISLVVDTRNITLYQPDGNTITIPQGNPRVSKIIEQAMPLMTDGIAEVDIGIPEQGAYEEFEKQTGGFIKFFKVAKSKLSNLFSKREQSAPSLELISAVEEVMTHAEPVRPTQKPTPQETVIAVVDGEVIPGVEQVQDHINHAVKLGSTVGMERFLQRVAKVISTRQHSIEDLLRFMEKGDLPVADDGSIIAYKMLQAKDDTFVDCHTNLVPQNVGTVVRVDESLVDRNRRNECSNGLHIARRGYLKHFGGSACFLVKVAPEDVVTVPHNDPNKVRVCAYHIIDKLSDSAMQSVRQNKPMTSCADAREMLAKAIAGDHVGMLEEVRITEQMGKGLVITRLGESTQTQAPTTTPKPDKALAIDDPELVEKPVEPVSPLAVAKEVQQLSETKESPVKSVGPYAKVTNREAAQTLATTLLDINVALNLKVMAAEQLRDLRKTSKKSWDSLGVDSTVRTIIDELLKDQVKVKVSTKTKQLSKLLKPKGEAPKPAINVNIIADRDKEVARLLGLGKTKAEVSRLTGVSTRTIGRIMDKLAS